MRKSTYKKEIKDFQWLNLKLMRTGTINLLKKHKGFQGYLNNKKLINAKNYNKRRD